MDPAYTLDMNLAKNYLAHKVYAGILLLLFCGTSEVLANAETPPTIGDFIAKDPREIKNRLKNKDYNPIGIVKTAKGRGTGWVTDSCLVLTAKHNIGAKQNIIGQKIEFYVGQTTIPGKNFQFTESGIVVASGNPSGDSKDELLRDWALIRLNSRIGSKVGVIPTFQYSGEDARTCKSLEVAGFPGEKPLPDLWWQGDCKLSSSGDTLYAISCPITQGNSGGPLLCRETDGTLNAIGMTNWSDPNAPSQLSIAMNFTQDWLLLKSALQKYATTCDH